ncbi:hypothetical protein [Neobacillus muris]|uniref:hypothetical protein n=1 Tax=Neobacillus muris TaxID=2941334 RepID=UPI00203DE811|nr:hypothetical protein [Neobacillus muris]
MLNKCSEDDFTIIRDVAFGRLRPNRIPLFFMATLVFSLVIIAFSLLALGSDGAVDPLLSLVILIDMALFVVHLFFALFFLNDKFCYKFQRFQSILLCIISFKFSIETYLAYFFLLHDRNAAPYMAALGLVLFLGGIVFIILSTIRVMKRVQQGEFRRGGKGLFNFSDSKVYISLPFFFGIVMLAGFLPRIFSDDSSYMSAEPFVALFFCFIIQYGVAMAWPEFYLLSHCKSRFDSFIIERPQRNGKGGAAYENKTKSNKI